MKFGNHTVVRVRPALVPSDYGTGMVADWSDTDRKTIKGCSVQPAPADEFTVDRDSVTTRWQAWLPHPADVEATDRIEWNGDTYEVDGEPLVWDFPPLHHTVVNLQRSEDS